MSSKSKIPQIPRALTPQVPVQGRELIIQCTEPQREHLQDLHQAIDEANRIFDGAIKSIILGVTAHSIIRAIDLKNGHIKILDTDPKRNDGKAEAYTTEEVIGDEPEETKVETPSESAPQSD